MKTVAEAWPYRVETGIGEEQEDIEKRWEIYRWQKANMDGIEFRAGLEWIDLKRKYEMCYRFKDETSATMFKIVWGRSSSCDAG